MSKKVEDILLVVITILLLCTVVIQGVTKVKLNEVQNRVEAVEKSLGE